MWKETVHILIFTTSVHSQQATIVLSNDQVKRPRCGERGDPLGHFLYFTPESIILDEASDHSQFTNIVFV